MNPFTPTTLASLAQQHGTPLWVLDAATMVRQIQALRPFDVIRFAQKANSNIHVLRLMREQGVVVDSVSLGEIERALAAGYQPGLHDGPEQGELAVSEVGRGLHGQTISILNTL